MIKNILKKIKSKVINFFWSNETDLYKACKNLSRKEIIDLLEGYLVLSKTNITTQNFNNSLIRSYCKTNGYFQKFVSEKTNYLSKHSKNKDHKLILVKSDYSFVNLGNYTNNQNNKNFNRYSQRPLDALVREGTNLLKKNGYYQIPFKLSKENCQKILNKSESFDYSLLQNDEKVINNVSFKEIKSKSPIAAYANESSLIKDDLILSIGASDIITSIVYEYLGPSIFLKNLLLWYSFPSSKPSSEAAQIFHFDQDCIKWLKVFIFLSDIEIVNGPHEAILSSHIPGSKPASLLKKGYSRFSDNQLRKFYDTALFKIFTGSKGTIILADTRCWHKGNNVLSGTRAMLQYQYTNCIEQCIIKNI